MSTAQIYAAVERVVRSECSNGGQARRHLDIGAGRGELIRLLGREVLLESRACDFHVERYAGGTPVDQVDLNREPLAYPDASFDLVTCSEVIEHLENYRALVREASRVLKPGGLLVLTTPNVLNAYSRLRYLASGFANLFGPLPLRNERRYSTAGHITPVPYFYLAHALMDAGFSGVTLSIDKVQKTSLVSLALISPLLVPGWYVFRWREARKYRTLTTDNRPQVARHFSWPLLVGRTIVVWCRKAA